MSKFARVLSALTMFAGASAGGVFLVNAAASLPALADEEHSQTIPNFSSANYGWLTIDDEFKPMTTGPRPIRNDPNYRYYGNQSGHQPNFRVSDAGNPVLTEWSREIMRKSNTDVIDGNFPYTFQSRCMPGGVPGQLAGVFEPVYFAQSAKEVLMMWQRDHVVRHIYMNVPHTKDPKPSWYGESVGHYEGDTLVVDTIGLSTKSFVDNWGTPHSEKLHVVERYRLVNGGYTLQGVVTMEDPIAFTEPYSVYQQWRRQDFPMIESVCAEGVNSYYGSTDSSVPVAEKPDF
jgi:hypothetical protein